MQSNAFNLRNRGKEVQIMQAGVGVMFAVLFVALLLYGLNSDISATFPFFFIIPWLLALLVVLLIPSAVLWYRGEWTLEHPLIFATFSYFIPAFVFGGFALAAGVSQPYFLVYIQDAETNLPFTIQLIMLGYAGLAIGYFLPVGRLVGEFAARFFRKSVYTDSSYLNPTIALLIVGIISSTISIIFGLFGYQRATEIGIFDGVLFLATLFWLQASFMLWFLIFRAPRLQTRHIVAALILLAAAAAKALFAGNRSSLIQAFICILLAFLLSGRQFKARHFVSAGFLLVASLLLGMVYGTVFREVKGSEDRDTGGSYTTNIFDTIDKIGTDYQSSLLGTGFTSLAERMDTLSSVAVVVSNYEQLAPYEASYGLNDNITRDLVTFLVPRVIWPGKPLASEPRQYSALYFNYGENSFAITPIGDLIRNFGVPGVFLGMLILGMILRFLYRWLVEGQVRVLWRSTLYFMLLTGVSYEGFYGSILPLLVKVGITVVVGILVVHFLAKRTGGKRISAV
jgi:oligosaccharide repeat unit polymerase